MSSVPSSARLRLSAAALTVLLALRIAGAAQSPPASPEGSQPRFSARALAAHVDYLASEALQGRAAGTEGARKAARYIADRFREAGLRPAGPGGRFAQRFPFTAGVKLGTGNQMVVYQGKRSRRLTLNRDFVPLASSEDGLVSGEVVFVGYGIRGGSPHYDDYAGVDVRGKVVVALRKTPEGDDPRSRYYPFAPLRTKALAARDAGARAILFVNGPVGGSRDSIDAFRQDAGPSHAGILAATLSRSSLEEMMRAGGRDLAEVQRAINESERSWSFPLPGVRVRLRTDIERERRTTENVLGLLEGADPALRDEVVVIGAHYDHVGLEYANSRATDRAGQVHYGADDNASGTAGLLELAAYFGQHRSQLKRSLLFAAFSAEELGLLGSAYFVRNPTVPLERVVAMVNLDMIGRLRGDTLWVFGTGSSPEWPSVLERANNPTGLALRMADGSLAPSDQSSFYVHDIPVLMFHTGTHAEYHTPDDKPATLNTEGEAELLRVVAKVVRAVADAAERPRFARTSEPAPGPLDALPVYLGTLPDYDDTSDGVLLLGVREGSPAARAGLRAGDVITSLADRPVRNVYDLTDVLRGLKAGEAVAVVARRGGEEIRRTVTPEARPRG